MKLDKEKILKEMYINLGTKLPTTKKPKSPKSPKKKNSPKIDVNNLDNWDSLDKKWQRKFLTQKFVKLKMSVTLEQMIGVYDNKILAKLEMYIKNIDDEELDLYVNEFGITNKNNKNLRKAVIQHIKDMISQRTKEHPLLFNIIMRVLEVDLVLLTSNYKIVDLTDCSEPNNKFLIVYRDRISDNINKYRYTLVGLKTKNDINYVFNRNRLPHEVDMIIDKHILFLTHLRDILKENHNITLNAIVRNLETILQTPLSKEDKKLCLSITNQLLD